VACLQGVRPAVVFYSLGHPTPYAYAPLTISYEPEADMTSVYDQIHAATNLPMDLLCVTKLGSTDAFNFSESTLEELGIQGGFKDQAEDVSIVNRDIPFSCFKN
jgi:hypothetical protein